MNKKTTINIVGFIVMLLIMIILSLAYVYGATINLDSGSCISNGTRNGTQQQICAKSVQCSSIRQNFSCNPQPSICRFNLSCPQPVTQITNQVNNTIIQQPIISSQFFKDNQLPIFAILGGIIVLIAWRNGWLNKLKPEKRDLGNLDYYDSRDRTTQVARDLKDTDFKELK